MNRLEQMAKRIEKRLSAKEIKSKKSIHLEIKNYKKIARLFHTCGKLCELNVLLLKKKL